MKKIIMLKKNYEFKYVLNKGKCYRGNYIDIYIKKYNLNQNRLGIAISRKITNAVKRNKIKRLIRENYRLLENRMEKGYSLVILWNKRANVEDANFFYIQKDMLNILKRADIIE